MCRLLLLWFFSAGFVVGAQNIDGLKFSQLSTSNGLSNNQVNSIFQDDQGFIWIGTLSGLNKYDGYRVKTYYHESGDAQSLLNNSILWMAAGPDNKIWINTGEGISLYDQQTESFGPATQYTEELQTEDVFIRTLQKDGNGDTWFVIQDRGLVKLPEGSGQIVIASGSVGSDIRIASNDVTDITSDEEGNIWIIHAHGMIEVIDIRANRVTRKFGLPDSVFPEATGFWFYIDEDKDAWIYTMDEPNGLFFLNTTSGETRHFGERELTSEVVRDIVQDENGKIWIGADHGGISILDKKNWKIHSVQNDPDDPFSLISNNVNTLFADSRGIVWAGTAKKGLSYYSQESNNFHHHKYPAKNPSYNDMSSAVEDKQGNIWIGTNGQGVLYFDADKEHFIQNAAYQRTIAKIESDVVVSLMYTSTNDLWIGTYLEGLKRYSETGQLTEYYPDEGEKISISSNSIWSLFEDSNGYIWIGTLNSGVDRLDPETGDVVNFSQTQGQISANYVTCITEGGNGSIWIGTGTGLSMYSPKYETFKVYSTSEIIPNSLSSNSITSLLFDSSGTLWVGTMGGLNKYNPDTDDFTTYKEADGLSSDIINALLEDDQQNIWMSTSKGITRLSRDGGNLRFQVFDASDGLQGDHFSEKAALKLRDGRLMFMGQNGFNLFDPEEIKINREVPELAFTDLYISNTHVKPGEKFNGRVLLHKNLNYTDKVELDFDENSLAVEFVALTYFQSQKNNYQYKLEGFDEEWMNVSTEMRRANYTNLDYGNYRFRVRASNNHNIWNEQGIGFDIVIHPPWWQTAWAYLVYVVVGILVLYLTRRFIVTRERNKARIESERREAQRQHELDLMKIKFFTNISHEFRTPLSLVLTPIEGMIKNPDNVKVNDFKMIQRNAKRLLTLVNQLLDFRKMEANQHVLSESNGDFVKFIKDIVESFSDLSREKEIQLLLESEIREYYTLFDKDKMEKIMFNLLSNAFKFTLPGGKIIVDVEKNENAAKEGLVVTVSDTGIGMPEEKLPFIFNRFFQNDYSGSNIINNGTGIGLSITKEFVELHNGHIRVESTPDVGTSFIVELPLTDLSHEAGHSYSHNESETSPAEIETTATSGKHEQTVVLVEDNSDFRFYLKDNLKQYFNVLESTNGKDAWKVILDQVPDIVITDIMMPVMNGLELCRKIKGDPRTAHIPVVLLTAQSSDQHKIEGLEAGAIEYISKPFNFEILVSTINSALRFQKRVNEAQKKVEVKTSEIDIVSVDEQLVNKAVKLVEENISNSSFSVEDMSHELGYSRGHFYQKMIKITGQTPMDFIRNIRMKRAAELLKKSQLTVSEIAYKVGYNNPKLFSRYFKSQYKMYPSEYMNMHKERKETVK